MSLQNQLDKNEIVPIASLVSDPANARKHSPKNLEAIKGSLAQFGQQKPLVVAENNVVIAGNGTLWAMRDLGMKEVWISRSGLEGAKATGYAIADNRSGELAEWDDDVLSKTLEALKGDIDLGSIGFDEVDLKQLIGNQETGPGNSENKTLSMTFGAPPFSVLDARQGYWQERKREWLSLGIRSEIGRGGHDISGSCVADGKIRENSGTTLGAIAPNEATILKRTGKYATR